MPKTHACPSCRAPMQKQRFGRQPYGDVIIDVCWDCHALWFDQYESTTLTPRSVIDLFRLIHDHRDKPARTLADSMACPHCRARLAHTQDIQRTNRITYHRCPNGHGRLTTFFQFLREKQFVRSLSKLEIEGLRATVKQVRCSGCGAVVDLAKDPACSYCRSPISVLDAAAVEKTLAALDDAQRKRTSPNAEELASAFESLIATHKQAQRPDAWTRRISPIQGTPAMIDLVVDGLGRLFR
jgi:Zn-finger nucleic acid-binding protein